MKEHGLSITLFEPTDFSSIPSFLNSLDQHLAQLNLPYEILLLVHKMPSDYQQLINQLTANFPIKIIQQSIHSSKDSRLAQGFGQCRFDLIAAITEHRGFNPETITEMVKMISSDKFDLVVAQRNKTGFLHALIALSHNQQKLDVRSGLRVFKKEISDRIYSHFRLFSYDVEFLSKALDAGYKIGTHQIESASLKSHNHHTDPSWRLFFSSLKHKFGRSEVIPFHPDVAAIKGRGFHYKGQEFIHHSSLTPSQSAIHRLSGMQMFILLGLLLEVIFFFAVNWHVAIVLFISFLTFLYFADLLFNLYLIYRSFSKPAEVQITQKDIDQITDWPTYTIMCPLYKEWRVIPQFVTAMSHLDYPKDKMQVMLLLEEDDKETIREVQKCDLPSYFDIVVVPDSKPKTKPKASNYGLMHATGEYIVIFDAEDVPDPLQLKKAVLAYSKTNKRTICIQAKLNFYNPHQNLLTRVFTAEYSLWFDLVLTGLQSIHAPIPLGGTSNHFKKADLIKLKGWDSFNVTEDCDLGMRLVKQGYQTAVINSTTLEEANSSLSNWFNQRTRWIKGYMQTYLIHMRDPHQFLKNWREPHAITFQLVVGGKVLSMFINPIMWVITLCYFLFRAHIGTFIESFFPTPILYMGVISLLLGNFLYVYYYMIGCARHGHHELVKYGVFIPLYWLCMSIAAWMAVYKLIVAPHHWAKTKHGLHLDNAKAVDHATKAIGQQSLVDKKLTSLQLQPAV